LPQNLKSIRFTDYPYSLEKISFPASIRLLTFHDSAGQQQTINELTDFITQPQLVEIGLDRNQLPAECRVRIVPQEYWQ